jgi:hypothetical protein
MVSSMRSMRELDLRHHWSFYQSEIKTNLVDNSRVGGWVGGDGEREREKRVE